MIKKHVLSNITIQAFYLSWSYTELHILKTTLKAQETMPRVRLWLTLECKTGLSDTNFQKGNESGSLIFK